MDEKKLIKRLKMLGNETHEFVRSDLADDIKKQIPRKIKTAKILHSKLIRFAAAAVIIAGAGIFILLSRPAEKIDDNGFSVIGETPAEMLTLASLNMAYRRGGMEAVERQYQNAFKNTGPRPVKLTIEDLFAELNGG